MMKKTKSALLAAFVAMAALAMQSCLGDSNDDNSNQQSYLSKQDASLLLLSMMGNYEGQIYYANRDTQKTDSCDVSIYTNGDSILHLVDVPSEVVASFLNPIPQLKQAVIDKLGNTAGLDLSIVASNIISSTDNSAQGTVYAFPLRGIMKINSVDYKSAAHDFLIQYSTWDYYSLAVYGTDKRSGKKVIQFNLFNNGIYDQKDSGYPIVNGFQTTSSDSNNPYCSYMVVVTR